ncbi:type II secretion system F family protein [Filifactor alocis]|uniref:type II secretion system F family protein n=1 Tax=Filifactor alocis TaxID=143361 RepID=UPI0028D0F9E5|nr:type II secretion system F family protein [Filifactor alocis]
MDKIFNYRAVDSTGIVVEDVANAENEDAVILMLRGKGYTPISIKEKVQSKEISFGNSGKLNLKDVISFCRQESIMLKSGMDLNRSLDVLAKQSKSKKLKKNLFHLSDSVKKGTELSKSMENQGSAFPYLLKRTVQAGEMSGQMAEIIEKMAVHYEKDMKLRRKIRGAMMYPIVLAIIAVIAVSILLIKVMPGFVSMFEGVGMELPALTRFVMGLSSFLVHNWIWILLVLFAVIFSIRVALQQKDIRIAWDKIKLKLPLIGTNVGKIVTARFTRTLSTMLYSGIPMIQALRAAGETTGNKFVESKIEETVEGIEKGMGMTAQLAATNIFPPMMLSMIGIGEESGRLDEMLETTADYYDEEMEVALESLVTMLEPLLIVIMGVVIGTIVVAMYLPMFDIIQTVK